MEVFEFKRIETALGNVLRNMRDITLAYAACSDKAAAVRKSSDYTDQAKEKKESEFATEFQTAAKPHCTKIIESFESVKDTLDNVEHKIDLKDAEFINCVTLLKACGIGLMKETAEELADKFKGNDSILQALRAVVPDGLKDVFSDRMVGDCSQLIANAIANIETLVINPYKDIHLLLHVAEAVEKIADRCGVELETDMGEEWSKVSDAHARAVMGLL